MTPIRVTDARDGELLNRGYGETATMGGAGNVYQHAPDPSPHVDADGGRARMAIEHSTKLCECGCGRPVFSKTASFVMGHRKFPDAWTRIRAKCVEDGGCLVWQGAKVLGGYGQIRLNTKYKLVHRAVYEYFYGPIPVGLTIDHVWARGCHSRACCNPAHLEAVTFRENVRRGTSFAVRNAHATHCPSGHPYDLLNTKIYEGRRYCRACKVLSSRALRRRKKSARAD